LCVSSFRRLACLAVGPASPRTLGGASPNGPVWIICRMSQSLSLVCLLVRDYDEAIAFYRDAIGFELAEDTWLGADKRWVVVRPKGPGAAGLLLAKASNPEQVAVIGGQTGGRVFLFLNTDNLDRDHNLYRARGVVFVREPVAMPYGKVAVFKDLYGNLWDLIEPSGGLAQSAA